MKGPKHVLFRHLKRVPLGRSEIFGYTNGGRSLNPKHEIRTKYPYRINPKRFGRLTALSNVEGQYLMIQI